MLVAILAAVCLAGALFAGLSLGRRNPRWTWRALSFAAFLIFARLVMFRIPVVEYSLFPWDWYASVRPWWGFAAALFFCGAAIFLVRRMFIRILVEVGLGFVLLVAGNLLVASFRFDHSDKMENFPDGNGLLLQSTDYTCGAAGAAMLLHLFGVKASEGEMAQLCGTTAVTGTDEFCVRRGLRKKLRDQGRDVVIEELDYDELLRTPMPYMAVVSFGYLLDHWVLVTSFDEGRFVVKDPLGGEKTFTEKEFLGRWKRVIVRVVETARSHAPRE